MHDIVDTFPAFLTYWNRYRSESTEDQIKGWLTTYMVKWPELLKKQINELTIGDITLLAQDDPMLMEGVAKLAVQGSY